MKPSTTRLSLVVDLVILVAAIVLSLTLLSQHSDAMRVTVDSREERYFRAVDPAFDLVYGNPEADLFIVEHGDLECDRCRDFHPHMKSFIQGDWGVSGRVAWVWRNGFHINTASLEKAKTLECIRRHGGSDVSPIAWDFIEESLMGGVHEEEYPYDRYQTLMETLDLPSERIETCRKNNEVASEITLSVQDVLALDIGETPYLQFISGNGELLFESVGVLTTTQIAGFVSSIMQASADST